MNAARRIRQLMADITVQDRKIFGSISFGNYLRTLLSIPCRTIGRNVPYVFMHFPESEAATLKGKALAFWDGQRIYIDSESSFVTKLPTREYKAAVLTGLLVHEYGHYRFTDLAGCRTAVKKLSAGTWYPKLPDELPDAQESYRLEVEEFINSNKEANPRKVQKLLGLWHDIYNIMEDGYIEECLYHCMSGILVDGLNSLRFFQKESAMALKDMLPEIGKDFDMYDVVSSLLLMYCKFGTLKCNWDNPEESESEPVSWIAEARAYVDQVLYASSTSRRLKGVHMTFLSLWPIIKEHIEHMPDSDDEGGSGSSVTEGSERTAGMMRSSSYDGTSGGRPVPVDEDEDTGKSGSRSSRKETAKHLSKRGKDSEYGSESPNSEPSEEDDSSEGKSPDGEEKSTSSESGEDTGHDEAEADDGESPLEPKPEGGDSEDGEVEGPERDGSGSCEKHEEFSETDTHTAPEDDGEVEFPDCPDEGSDMTIEDIEESFSTSEIESTMRRIETEIKKETAIDTVNDELTHELESEAKTLDYGEAHRGIHPKVERVSEVSDTARVLYDSTMDSIKQIAAIAAKRVKPLLKKETDQNRMAMSGYYSGSKFDATRLVMNDCRVFKNSTSPLPDTRVALSVVVDESGSMSGARIKAARTAAIALYEFCSACEIPCSIIGHTADGHGWPIYTTYADFETPDALDKYRLLNISAKWDNRDGAAILFAGERILKRDEPVKLMFIISDGAPLAEGYEGLPAEHDMSNIVANLRRKGLTVFAAAIGSDKENIHRIFGEGFLDITNIGTLPDQLLQLVKRYIR